MLFPTPPWTRQGWIFPFIWRNLSYLASLVSLECYYAWQQVLIPSLLSPDLGEWEKGTCGHPLRLVPVWPDPGPHPSDVYWLLKWLWDLWPLDGARESEMDWGLMPGYESASAAPRALEKHSSPVLTEQRTQGRVWWESDWAIHGQMLYKLQLPYKYMVPWFKKETSSKHHRNLLKILEQLFFSLLMLEIYSAFLRNHDFTYYLLLLDHIISILGLGRAESKL